MRPICVGCRREFRCSKNGKPVAHDGVDDPTVFWGDEYACPECDARIVVGFSQGGRPASHCTAETRAAALVVRTPGGHGRDHLI